MSSMITVDQALQKIKKLQQLQVCRSEGHLSSRHGLPFSANPYPPATDESTLWSEGWVQESIILNREKAISILEWSRDTLGPLGEKDEKVRFVVQKIEEFLGE